MKSQLPGLALGLVVGSFGLGGLAWTVQARPRPQAPAPTPTPASAPAASIQDALLKPFDLPFEQPTPLEDVAKHLARGLSAPVVLDRAALDRLELTPASTVQLQLAGVRLKTGLQLLLDQVGLTYRVVPEDNLLVLTDSTGADDPARQALAEVRDLHRDLHDLQDTVDDLYRMLTAPGDDAGVPLKAPTIIEEAPANPGEKPEPTRTRPG